MNQLFSNNEDDSNNQTELSTEQSLELLVGDGKKYANAGELAKAMVHSQSHITTLESEATTLREQALKQSSIDDVIAAVKSNGSNEQTPPGDNQAPADQLVNDPSKTVDIAQQIKDELAKQAQTTSAASNVAMVTEALNKSLGARANEVYMRVGKENGVDLDELSKLSPQAVIQLCTGQQAPARQTGETLANQHINHNQVVVTDVNLMNLAQIKAHAATVKMPREERFQLEMENALKQGDSFFDKN